MRKAFAGLATLLMLAVVVQFYLAGSAAFSTAPNDESFAPHRLLGMGILLFAVLTTLVAALARMPGRLVGMTGLVAGLAAVQVAIGVLARVFGETGDITTTAGTLIFGLHAVNGLAIVAVIGRIIRRARTLSRSTDSSRAGAGEDAVASGQVAGSAQPAS